MSLVGHDQSRRHIERSRFTGTVRSEQSDDLTLLDVKRDMISHSTFAVTLDQPFGMQLLMFQLAYEQLVHFLRSHMLHIGACLSLSLVYRRIFLCRLQGLLVFRLLPYRCL